MPRDVSLHIQQSSEAFSLVHGCMHMFVHAFAPRRFAEYNDKKMQCGCTQATAKAALLAGLAA